MQQPCRAGGPGGRPARCSKAAPPPARPRCSRAFPYAFSLWRRFLVTVPVLKSSLRPLAKQIPSVSNPVGGMLEHATLLLRTPDSFAVQAVVEPSTYAPLGFVRLRPLRLVGELVRRPSAGGARTRGRIPAVHDPQQPASAGYADWFTTPTTMASAWCAALGWRIATAVSWRCGDRIPSG